MPEKSELEWTYDPADFFESPYQHTSVDFDLIVNAGRAVATLRVPQDPVPQDVERSIETVLESLFLVRQVQIHAKYNLQGPRTYQHSAGRKNISICLDSAVMVCTVGKVDLITTDSAGKILHDSRKERIAAHSSELKAFAPKLPLSATLQSLLASYSRAVTDPSNELVHLYEIRDALARHYGGEETARNTLGISKGEWNRLGILANAEPLEQGRHRGRYLQGRRVATEAELNEARHLARRWIAAFASMA